MANRKKLNAGEKFICIYTIYQHSALGDGICFFDGKEYTANTDNTMIDETGIPHTFDEGVFEDYFHPSN